MSGDNITVEPTQVNDVPMVGCVCGTSSTDAESLENQTGTPLHRVWSYYLVPTSKGSKNEADWQTNQTLVCRFNTVEQFWRLYNNMSTPRELDAVDLCLCHDDLMLAWEHPRFARGGKWTIRMAEMGKLDQYWLNLALGSIGEQLSGSCGVSVSIRKAYSKATLWLDNDACTSLAAVQMVGRRAATLLAPLVGQTGKLSLQFSFFHDIPAPAPAPAAAEGEESTSNAAAAAVDAPEPLPADINQKWTFYVDGGVVSDCKVEVDPPAVAGGHHKGAGGNGGAGGKYANKGPRQQGGNNNRDGNGKFVGGKGGFSRGGARDEMDERSPRNAPPASTAAPAPAVTKGDAEGSAESDSDASTASNRD